MTIETPNNEPRSLFKANLDDATKFERPGFDGYVQVTPEQGLGFAALTVDVHGAHPRKRIVEGTRTYYVTEGSGTFTLGEETHDVQPGDLFVIPEGGEYNYEGTMTLFEMNIPSAISPTGAVVDEKLDQ